MIRNDFSQQSAIRLAGSITGGILAQTGQSGNNAIQ
jgi:hypothetical protein